MDDEVEAEIKRHQTADEEIAKEEKNNKWRESLLAKDI